MHLVSQILIALIAVIHVYFLVLEMFLWRTERVRALFGSTAEFAEQSKTLAANQGLYNGFLAAGLVFSLIVDDRAVQAFFLVCVLIAGVYGGLTATRRILMVQALPALIALVFVALA